MAFIDETDARRIGNDIVIAINALESIQREIDGSFPVPEYIIEKAKKAQRCVSFVLNCAEKYKED